METRGREKNNDKIKQAQELRDQGLNNKEISDIMGISNPMVRYYLKQTPSEERKRESLGTCFFRQPREVQERIATEIGYILPPMQESEEVTKTYKKVEDAVKQEEVKCESKLLFKCMRFLYGKIAVNEIEDVFTQDEMRLLSQNKVFMSKADEMFGGEKSTYTIEEVIEELKNNGIK